MIRLALLVLVLSLGTSEASPEATSHTGDGQQPAEDSGPDAGLVHSPGDLVASGGPLGDWNLYVRDGTGDTPIATLSGRSATGNVSIRSGDRHVQEDSVELVWRGPASVVVAGMPADFQREANGDMAIALEYRVLEGAEGRVWLSMADNDGGRGRIEVTGAMRRSGDWRRSLIKLSCFADAGTGMDAVIEPLVITSDGRLAVLLSSARIVANTGDASCRM